MNVTTAVLIFVLFLEFYIGKGHYQNARYQWLLLVMGVIKAGYQYSTIGNGHHSNARYQFGVIGNGYLPVTDDGLSVTQKG